MKKLAIFTAILIVLSSFVITDIGVAQPGETGPPCGAPVLIGCIGACCETVNFSFRLSDNGAYCFTTTESTLCPDTGAEVTIYVNDKLRFNSDMTNGVFLVFGGKETDIIRIEANLFPIDNEEPCALLGDLYYKIAPLGKKGQM